MYLFKPGAHYNILKLLQQLNKNIWNNSNNNEDDDHDDNNNKSNQNIIPEKYKIKIFYLKIYQQLTIYWTASVHFS